MTRWIVWGTLLALTNGFSTLVSRARNTPSYGYHGICALLNHATWFVVNVMFVGVAIDIGALKDWRQASLAWLFYTACSTTGSMAVHFISLNYLEKGNRRVGAYGD
jgi:hypothetical protein